MRRPRHGNQLLTQHLGRSDEQEEQPPPTRLQTCVRKLAAPAEIMREEKKDADL